jgi:tripartite-type tricarboxylate transporter receptor subunit TctC
MKKLLAVLLAMAMMLALAACGDTGSQNNGGQNGENQSGTGDTNTDQNNPSSGEVTFDKTIKLIVPYDAGGGVYNAAIIVAAEAQKYLGTTIDVVCMAGNGGQEGIEYVYNQASDGYTLLATDYGPLISTAIEEDVVYQLDEFTPIIEMTQVLPTFFVKSDSPYQTMEDLIEAAKANPGQISVGHGKFHSVPHLPLMLLEDLSGADFNEVPTSGGSEALAFTLGGSVDVGASVPSTVAGSVAAGDLRVLAVAAEDRAPEFPDAPTLKELGYEVSMPAWYTIFCKSDVPQEIRDALEQGLADVIASAEAQETAAASNVTLTGTGSAESHTLYNNTIRDLTTLLG